MLHSLQVIDSQLFTFYSSRSFGYAPYKMFQFENQVVKSRL